MHRPFWGLLGGDLGKTRCWTDSSRWWEAVALVLERVLGVFIWFPRVVGD